MRLYNKHKKLCFEPKGSDSDAVQYCVAHYMLLMTMLCKGFQTLSL